MTLAQLAVLYPVVATHPVDLWPTGDDGGGAPIARLRPGLVAEVGVARIGAMHLLVSASQRVEWGSWTTVGGDPLRMSVSETGLELGGRWQAEAGAVRPAFTFGYGPHLMVMDGSWRRPLAAAGGGLHGGFALAVGEGPVKLDAELRLVSTLRLDQWGGSGVLDGTAFGWRWNPGSLGVVGLVGAQLGGRGEGG